MMKRKHRKPCLWSSLSKKGSKILSNRNKEKVQQRDEYIRAKKKFLTKNKKIWNNGLKLKRRRIKE
jgi:hypothetical protein